MLDNEREEHQRLMSEYRKLQLQPNRVARQLEAERTANKKVEEALGQTLHDLRAEHEAEVKATRQSVAAERRRHAHELQSLRVEHAEQVIRLEGELTEIERELRRVRSTLRRGDQAAEAAAQEADAEKQRLRERGRAWSRVEQEQHRAERAERELRQVREEFGREASELRSAARARNTETAAEKQELKYLRHEKKEWREKMATFKQNSNLKFFEVDPFLELNRELREKLTRYVTHERVMSKVIADLESIACPPYSRFYEGRLDLDGVKIGGVQVAEEWEMFSMALTTFNISSNRISDSFLASCQFLGVQLPKQEHSVYFKSEGVSRKQERFCLPSSTHAKDTVELGGELCDLITFGEIAEGTAIALTFDGATIASFPVFGGGVCMMLKNGKIVRRMAFQEIMGRETCVNKLRRLYEFFARGKALLELVQHPLAHRCDVARVQAKNGDRGGADGRVGDQLEAKLVKLVKARMGAARWVRISEVERDELLDEVQDWDDEAVQEAYASAQEVRDDAEYDRAHVDLEYQPVLFDQAWETSRERLSAEYLLGWEEYDKLPTEAQVMLATSIPAHTTSHHTTPYSTPDYMSRMEGVLYEVVWCDTPHHTTP